MSARWQTDALAAHPLASQVLLDPERWVRFYADGVITTDELFSGLASLVAVRVVDDVVGVVPEAHRDGFVAFLRGLDERSRFLTSTGHLVPYAPGAVAAARAWCAAQAAP